jgi:hypothetical protein
MVVHRTVLATNAPGPAGRRSAVCGCWKYQVQEGAGVAADFRQAPRWPRFTLSVPRVPVKVRPGPNGPWLTGTGLPPIPARPRKENSGGDAFPEAAISVPR